MATITKEFSAAGQTSPVLLLKKGQSATYGVTTSFAAVLRLQKTVDGTNWETVATVTDATLATTTFPPVDRTTRLRWLCSAYTSDTPTVSIATRIDTISEIVNADGDVVMRVTDEGIEALNVKGLGQTAVPVESAAVGTAAITTLLTLAGLLRLTGKEDTLTAHAGGTQAAALALSASVPVHIITVCATAADSVKLPTCVAGEIHIVWNLGAESAQAFGAGTSTINGVATATGVAIPAGKAAVFYGRTAGAAGAWLMLLGA